jgi:taurine dioxygenase
MALFGPIVEDRTQVGYVSNVRADGLFGDVSLSFHQDYLQTTVPLLSLSLHAVEVEGDVAPTAFASGERALAVMPPDLRAELLHRQVVNLWPLGDQVRYGRGDEDVTIEWPGAVHDVFEVDPITGRHIVTASPMMTARILGVGKEQSNELLAGLYKVLHAEDNLYHHQWVQGDLVIWSNLAVSHARGWLTSGRRTLQRVCTGQGTSADYKPPRELAKEYVYG